MSELIALVDGREMGTVRQERGRITFTYSEPWRAATGAYPLSLSMPLVAERHSHAAIEPFLWGLLPDNEIVLRRWAQRFHVSDRNPFALLANVGEDCAGAVQFVRPERVESFQRANAPEIEWLTEAEVAQRLRILLEDSSAGRVSGDIGQFSLAGAQPKTALLYDGQRWGVPSGRTPTTHILKPSTPEFDGHAENEHICLSLARALGLPVARSEVRMFEDVSTIVITRYDRVRTSELAAEAAARAAAKAAEAAMHASSAAVRAPALAAAAAAEAQQAATAAETMREFSKKTPIYRVHQEDLCQALAVHPANKYQNEGGPGPRQIVDLLRANVAGAGRFNRQDGSAPDAEDIGTFLDSLVYNWLVGGTDAHAKNYSLLVGGGGLVRLAPLYDIASILAYPAIDPQKAKLAMKVGDAYRLRDIGWSNWLTLASDIGVDSDVLISRARAMARTLPDHLESEVASARREGLSHGVIEVLAKAIDERARKLAGS